MEERKLMHKVKLIRGAKRFLIGAGAVVTLASFAVAGRTIPQKAGPGLACLSPARVTLTKPSMNLPNA